MDALIATPPFDVGKRDSWGKWVTAKENAIALLDKRKPGALYCKMIYMSSVTDPYQPIERKLRITRGLFLRIEENGGRVRVNITVTTDDEEVRRAFEPFCPSNPRRLAAIKELQASGIATCITMTPLLLVNDNGDFADELIDTGVKKFIAQPFHFVRGKFVASTRDVALNLMAKKLGCDRSNFGEEYLERYKEFFKVFTNKLLDNELPILGEGKDGFSPPF